MFSLARMPEMVFLLTSDNRIPKPISTHTDKADVFAKRSPRTQTKYSHTQKKRKTKEIFTKTPSQSTHTKKRKTKQKTEKNGGIADGLTTDRTISN